MIKSYNLNGKKAWKIDYKELQNDNSQQQELTDTSTNNSLYRNEELLNVCKNYYNCH